MLDAGRCFWPTNSRLSDCARTRPQEQPRLEAAEQEIEIARGKLTTARLISPFNPVIEGLGEGELFPEKAEVLTMVLGFRWNWRWRDREV